MNRPIVTSDGGSTYRANGGKYTYTTAMPANIYLPTTVTSVPKQTNVSTPVSNAGTQKYIDSMKYAAQQTSGSKTSSQSALDKLKAAQDADTQKFKAEAAERAKNPPATVDDSGDNPGNGNGGVKKVTVSTGGGRGNGIVSSPVVSTPTQPVPDTTVQDAYKAQMEAANERLKQAYEFQQSQLARAKDDAFREAYIKQQMVERGYPEQLAAAGIRGGAAQGVIARNNADYANQRTSIHNNYLTNLANAGQTYQQGLYGANEDYLANMAAYEQALKQMAIQHQYDKELAMLRASLG